MKRALIPSLFLFLAFGAFSCQSQSEIDTGFLETPGTPFTQNWMFTDSGSYSFDSSKVDFAGGATELTASPLTDNSDGPNGFGGATLTGVDWETSGSYLGLDHTGSATDLELDPTWTPGWSSILSYWKMNNSWADFVGANNGNVTGTVGFGAGFLGAGSGTFSAAGYVDTGSMTSINGSAQVTLGMWVYESSWVTGILASRNITGLDLYTDNTGSVTFQVGNSGLSSAAALVPLNQWFYIAATYDGTYKRIYINGQQIASQDSPGLSVPDDSADLVIGAWDNGDYKFSGSLDELAIWNTALSPSAIASIYRHQSAKYAGTLTSRVIDAYDSGQIWNSLAWTATLPFDKELPDNATATPVSESQASYASLYSSALMNQIVGLWHLDEASGAGSALDKSGHGNDGTPSSVSFGEGGKLGTAAGFDGSHSGISILDAPSLDTAATDPTVNVTAAAWIRSLPTGSYEMILTKTDTVASTTPYEFRLNPSGNLEFVVSYYVLSGGPVLTDGQWHHIAGTYDNATISLFIDGASVNTASVAGLMNANTAPVYIGRRSDGFYFDGTIDEVAVWSRALNAQEILQLARRGANRLEYQVRSCSDSVCASGSPPWHGPDNTDQTYFSELNNTLANAAGGAVQASSPLMTFLNFVSPANGFTTSLSLSANRYFQYRAILESDDTGTGCDYGSGATWCSPELQSVTLGPTHYDDSGTAIVSKSGFAFTTLSGFTESASCSSGTVYNLSRDGSNWYYWKGASWAAASGASTTANSAAVVNAEIPEFPAQVGTGTLYFKAFLRSSGLTTCQLSEVSVSGDR